VVLTGRFGEPPTLKLDRPELPLLRFLEQPRVYYPGVELVADVKLSVDTDPYLNDHVFRGDRLLPAVMGLEAMAHAAMAVTGSTEPPMFEEVKFARAITVPDRSAVTVRVATLVRERGRVEVVLRSEETAFQVDHFRAVCRFQPFIPTALESGDRGETPSSLPAGRRSNETPAPLAGRQKNTETPTPLPAEHRSAETPTLLPAGGRGRGEGGYVALDPERDLYGGLLFQSGRFRRLRGYRLLRATECVAEIAPANTVNWFSRYLPANLVLGDPGARDAAIHAIQACIPHATILPVAVDRVLPGVTQTPGPWFVHARERSYDGDSFVYDLELTDSGGHLLERWEGLHLHIAAHLEPPSVWPAPLLGPYLERRVRELIPGSAVDIVVEANGESDRRAHSDRAIQRATRTTVPVWRRSDGKPEVMEAQAVSAAHAGDVTLAVAGPGPLACDIEPVLDRPASAWHDLLGPDRFALAQVIAQVMGETETEAATRAWAATECLKKAGVMVNTPVILASSVAGWVLLASERLVTATFLAHVHGDLNRLAVAVLAGKVGT
jgi:enediyne polyketide synthase